MKKEQQNSYRQIFKANSLFGGVQVFQIIISIIRAKFIAVLLGPVGMGIANLMNAPLNMISNITGLGLSFSAVRDISIANETGDNIKIGKTIKVFRRWIWFTGLFGSVITLSLAPMLSQWSFGNRNYTWAFLWLSVTLLINSISSGQSTLLRGMRRLQDMAKSSVIGAIIGLITSLPLYYFFGIAGIVPALILSALTTLLLTWYFARKINVEPVNVTYTATYNDGKVMAGIGIMMVLSGFIGSVVAYILNIFISHHGGINDVGLYNAGWAITNQYVGLVFTAMGTDYYPRLAAISNDNSKIRDLVNQQAEIAILILAPIVILLLTTAPLVIQLFFTKQFLATVPFMQFAVLGMLFKAASWSMGFIVLAKGNSKLFLMLEIIANTLILLLNIGGYHFFGLKGLGISFAIAYILHYIYLYIISKYKFDFHYNKTFINLLLFLFIICLTSFIIIYNVTLLWAYLIGSTLFIFVTLFSFYELNKRLQLSSLIGDIKHKYFKK